MSHTGKHIKKSYRQLLYCHITAVRTRDDNDRKEIKNAKFTIGFICIDFLEIRRGMTVSRTH